MRSLSRYRGKSIFGPVRNLALGIFLGIFFSTDFAYSQAFINLQAIKTIESDGNCLAFNSRTECYGLYQISKVCLNDFNELNHASYSTQDLFEPSINEKIASWYFDRIGQMLNFYRIPVSIETVIASYNWGITNVVRWYGQGADIMELPEETRSYIEKYVQLSMAQVL
ncbi:MAG: lytic transglycosylase domain-containing protein [Candidatus Omnitrophica bacterium]|nr:lytic transglycosylase domain-containing protein [Candidatus Omnitrophota bacterium]